MKTSLIFLAGGKGLRLKNVLPKQYIEVMGKTLAQYALEPFINHPKIDSIIIVCDPSYKSIFENLLIPQPVFFASPGVERQFSLENGLKYAKEDDLVLVHDAARPLLEPEKISKLIDKAQTHPAVVLGVRSTSTLKIVDENQQVVEPIDRSKVWEIQTPQLAPKKLLHQALAYAQEKKLTLTDESSLMQAIGVPVKVVEGSSTNFKVTTAADLELFERIKRSEQYV